MLTYPKNVFLNKDKSQIIQFFLKSKTWQKNCLDLFKILILCTYKNARNQYIFAVLFKKNNQLISFYYQLIQ